MREEYKEICDYHLEAKNYLKKELKRSETMEYHKNQEIFEKNKQVFK